MGTGRLICSSVFDEDNAKLVKVQGYSTNYSTSTRVTNKMAIFEVPTPEKYKVTVINDTSYVDPETGDTIENNEVEFEEYIIVNDGEYKELEIGLNINDWAGIRRIVNAHLETKYLTVGHEIDMTLLDGTHHPMIIGAIDHEEYYPHQVIFVSKYALPYYYAWNFTRYITGGYNASSIKRLLNGSAFWNILPDECREVISDRKFYTMVYGSNQATNSNGKIWIPREMEATNTRVSAYTGEVTGDTALQIFPIFEDPKNRIKQRGENGDVERWCLATARTWGGSNEIGYQMLYMSTTGVSTVSIWTEDLATPQLPCFHIIADDTPEVTDIII